MSKGGDIFRAITWMRNGIFVLLTTDKLIQKTERKDPSRHAKAKLEVLSKRHSLVILELEAILVLFAQYTTRLLLHHINDELDRVEAAELGKRPSHAALLGHRLDLDRLFGPVQVTGKGKEKVYADHPQDPTSVERETESQVYGLSAGPAAIGISTIDGHRLDPPATSKGKTKLSEDFPRFSAKDRAKGTHFNAWFSYDTDTMHEDEYITGIPGTEVPVQTPAPMLDSEHREITPSIVLVPAVDLAPDDKRIDSGTTLRDAPSTASRSPDLEALIEQRNDFRELQPRDTTPPGEPAHARGAIQQDKRVDSGVTFASFSSMASSLLSQAEKTKQAAKAVKTRVSGKWNRVVNHTKVFANR